MNYSVRNEKGKYSLFFYHGSGKTLKSSYLHKDGAVALFDMDRAVQIGDKFKLGHNDIMLDDYSFTPDFLKAINK